MGSTKTTSAIVVVALTVAAAVYTLVAGNQPLLGLDLQGGVSVVLQPSSVVDPDTGEERDIDEEALDQTVEIIRSRVDALGVAEPEISRQGETIVVALPGVEEQQRALELVGQTAELRFRPLLFELPPEFLLDPEQDVDGESDGDEPASDESESDGDEPASDGESDEEEESMAVSGRFAALQDTTSTTADEAEEADTSTTADEAEESDTSTTADEAEESDTSTTADDNDGDTEETVVGEDGTNDGDDEGTVVPPTEQSTLDPAELAIIEACSISGVTPPEENFADRPVVLVNDLGNRLCLGPTLLTGDALETAGVSLDPAGQWTVNPTFRSGVDGIDLFNEAAALCFNGSPMCPPQQAGPGRLAIVLDNEVVSYPSINAEIFGRDQIVISGAFMEDDARDLASVLRFGALPLELETQQTRTVSATIGDDVLRSGVIAGLIGLALVAIYLLSYYRLAGLVAIAGLVISAVLLWAIISWFGENLGLALTLAGVVGLIVSVGVSADSNIVYFENVKDSYRGGRKIPTAVERAYQTAISTIVKADVVSLIAAALLYLLTVGAVRGFAFYLGLATLLDLFISWLFMRPALAFLARRQAVEKNPRLLGLPATGGDQ